MTCKWTVLFLVHAATEQTRTHVKALCETLKSTEYNEEIKVLFLYSGLQYSTTRGYRIQVTLHELMKEGENDQADFKEVLPGFGMVDIGDDKILKKVFADIRRDYPSERFLLFTWDHGTGFGIFETNPGERNINNRALMDVEMDIMKGNTKTGANKFTVDNHAQDKIFLTNNQYGIEINKGWLQNITEDIYIQEVFSVLCDLINLQKRQN